MNGIRCPQCSLINQLSAAECRQCHFPFNNLPPMAFVSVPIEKTFEAQTVISKNRSMIPQDNEIGRKTFFWYRVYCVVLIIFYLIITGLGLFLAIAKPATKDQTPEEVMITGIVYLIIGAILLIIYLVALFLPRKPYNWVVGIVMIALGMTSCCFLPFVVPLLIFWLKTETKTFFGRN